jgi:hypothetical protein
MVEPPNQVLDLTIPLLRRGPKEGHQLLDRPMRRIRLAVEDHVPAGAR